MKTRKIPMRKCVVTNERYPKNELTRIVKDKDNKVFIDTSGRANGRGAYLKLSLETIKLDRKRKALQRSLEIEIPEDIYLELESLCDE